jgi:hypothetical protein
MPQADWPRQGGPYSRRKELWLCRRIFAEYAAGKGPIANVKDLNAERIPGLAGVLWIASTILGNPKRRNGLLNNELYRGVIAYNRQHFIKDTRRPASASPARTLKANGSV